MLGFKRLWHAKITLAGSELIQRIRKNQFDLGKLSIQTKILPISQIKNVHQSLLSLS